MIIFGILNTLPSTNLVIFKHIFAYAFEYIAALVQRLKTLFVQM